MTGNPLAAELQRERDVQVAAAVAAERHRVADELRALLGDAEALRSWLAVHGLIDAGPGVTLTALMRDLRGTCGMCRGPAEFVAGGVGGPAFEREAPPESHGDATNGRKPLDAYPSDQTAPSKALRAPRAVPLLPATLPSEAYDPEHGDHADFVRTTGRCFATDCATHNPMETR